MDGSYLPGIEGPLPAGKVVSRRRDSPPLQPLSMAIHGKPQECPSHSGVEGSLPAGVGRHRLPKRRAFLTMFKGGPISRMPHPYRVCLDQTHSGIEGSRPARVGHHNRPCMHVVNQDLQRYLHRCHRQKEQLTARAPARRPLRQRRPLLEGHLTPPTKVVKGMTIWRRYTNSSVPGSTKGSVMRS